MKFETVRIYFLRDALICCHPDILLKWQRDATTFFSIMRLCSPLLVNDKITASRQTYLSPKYYIKR